MLEILINLILTSLFLQLQSQAQLTVTNLINEGYRLPQAEIRQLEIMAPQKNPLAESLGVKLTASSSIAIDQKTGKILYENQADELRLIASLTKLMTALVFLEHNPGWQQTITIESDDHQPGGIVYLIAGESVTVESLFNLMLVSSANEAAVALARASGLTPEEFVAAMNQKAKSLGLKQARFIDVTGLSDYNQATAREVVLLFKAAAAHPEILQAISRRDYELKIINKDITRRAPSTISVLGRDFGLANEVYQVEAGKTGYLEKAGYCFASQVSNQVGVKILSVVLGSATINDRFNDTKGLAYWVFNNYVW